MNTFLCSYPPKVVLNHFTPHSLHTPSQYHLYFLENLVYELHLGTKTLTRYCDDRASFNGICCPPLISYLWGQYAKLSMLYVWNHLVNCTQYSSLVWYVTKLSFDKLSFEKLCSMVNPIIIWTGASDQQIVICSWCYRWWRDTDIFILTKLLELYSRSRLW